MLVWLVLAGCKGAEEGPSDVRVDHVPSDSDAESTEPRSCVTADGRVYVAWQDDRDGTSAVWFNTSDDAGLTWRDKDRQLNSGDAPAFAPAIGCDGDRVHVAWEDARDGELAYHNVYVASSDDGGLTWSSDVALDADPEGDAMSVGPAVVAVGEAAWVAWFDARDGAYDVYVQATTDGGATWLPAPVRADGDAAGAAYSAWPRLVADASGRVVVAWEDSRDGASDVYVARSTDFGATFAGEQRLDLGDDPGSANSFLPRVAMAGDRVYVAWQDERPGDLRTVLLNTSADGGATWLAEPLTVRASEDVADAINPEIAAEGDRVHVVWQEDRYGGFDVYHRHSTDGAASWVGEEVRMDTDAGGEGQSYEPVVSIRDEHVLVAWQEYRNDRDHVGFDDLHYNWSGDGGEHWSEDDLRINANEPGTAYQVDLSVAAGDDLFVAVWADGRYGTSDVFCAQRLYGEEGVYVPPKK